MFRVSSVHNRTYVCLHRAVALVCLLFSGIISWLPHHRYDTLSNYCPTGFWSSEEFQIYSGKRLRCLVHESHDTARSQRYCLDRDTTEKRQQAFASVERLCYRILSRFDPALLAPLYSLLALPRRSDVYSKYVFAAVARTCLPSCILSRRGLSIFSIGRPYTCHSK